MDSVQALAVVRSLANGVDPESGEVFPARAPIRGRCGARALRGGERARAHRALRAPQRRSCRRRPASVSEDEDRKPPRASTRGRALQDLAAAHERTMGAVRARLLKYGPHQRLAAHVPGRPAGAPGFFRTAVEWPDEVKRDSLDVLDYFRSKGHAGGAFELARAG